MVDFGALVAELQSGRIRAAVDVFPSEPVAANDPVRHLDDAILSPHRAAAVPGGRHPIGRMIVEDLTSMLEGRTERQLQVAKAQHAEMQAGVGDAKSVGMMAQNRA